MTFRSAMTKFGLRVTAFTPPAWHPAGNVAARFSGANHALKNFTPEVYTGEGHVPLASYPHGSTNVNGIGGAFVSWTGFCFGPDVAAIDIPGGHLAGKDRSSYRLEDWLGANAPEVRVAWSETNQDYNECSALTPPNILSQEGVPSTQHNYNRHFWVPGKGPGTAGATVSCAVGGTGHGHLLTRDETTGLWSDRGSNFSGLQTSSDYDPVSGLVWGRRKPSSGAGNLYQIDPDDWSVIHYGSSIPTETDFAAIVDRNRRFLLHRDTLVTPRYGIFDLLNPASAGVDVVSLIPGAFPLKNSADSAAVWFQPTLSGGGRFVVWNGGNTFHTIRPQGSDFSDYSTLPWIYEGITVSGVTIPTTHASETSETGGTQGFYRKAGWIETADLVCIWIDGSGYYVVNLAA